MDKNTAFQKIQTLVEHFRLHHDSYHGSGYNETQVRREFIDPFWKALGWDIDNEAGALDAYKDVVHEDRVRVDGRMKAPDYCFKIYNDRKFYVEAKKPSIDIKADASPAYQIRNYGWNRKLAVSIVSDFEEFAVYDCGKKPKSDDKPAVGRLCYFTFEDYVTQFDFFWENFSKEAAVTGRFDKYARSSSRAKSGDTVDKEFLKSMDAWRVELAKNIAVNNEKLSEEDINRAVQLTIDRILFLRICEGREVEQNGNLSYFAGKDNCYKGLLKYFGEADDKYNSGIFDFKNEILTHKIAIEDNVIKNILKELYEGDYNFEAIPVEILGNAYEQFLGKIIRLTAGHHAKVEEKPEVRKAGGVYYTPQYIVDYIVKNTVGKLLEAKTPAEASKLRISDPACGSGSFLLGAYQCLLDWHLDWYLKNPPKEEATGSGKRGKGKQKESPLTPNGGLSTAEKKRILLNNIYGVDIDSQAVEVTKLSLLLKALEGETEASINTQMELFHERILPSLEDNIKCGNSLIGPDYFSGQLAPDNEELKRVNPFNWKTAFPVIFKAGGFDAVIGNPPYGRLAVGNEQAYLDQNHSQNGCLADYYAYFVSRTISLIRKNGVSGFIIPSAWLGGPAYNAFRRFCLSYKIQILISLPFDTFKDAYVDAMIIIFKNTDIDKNHFVQTFAYSKKAVVDNTAMAQLKLNPILQMDWFDHEDQKIILNKEGADLIINLYEKYKDKISDICEVKRGVLFDKSYLTRDKQSTISYPYFEGNVYRYDLQYKSISWIAFDDNLKERPKEIKWFKNERILLRRLVNRQQRLMAVLAVDSFITNKNLYSVLATLEAYPLKIILGLLNSKLFSYLYLSQISQATKDDFPQVTIRDILSLPLCTIDKARNDKMVSFVNSMLELHKRINFTESESERQALQRLIDDTDNKIDALVYELYGLTEEEIMIVEGEK